MYFSPGSVTLSTSLQLTELATHCGISGEISVFSIHAVLISTILTGKVISWIAGFWNFLKSISHPCSHSVRYQDYLRIQPPPPDTSVRVLLLVKEEKVSMLIISTFPSLSRRGVPAIVPGHRVPIISLFQIFHGAENNNCKKLLIIKTGKLQHIYRNTRSSSPSVF